MEKLIILFAATMLLFAGCTNNSQATMKRRPCLVTEVKEFRPGQVTTSQVSLEWHVKTDCGINVTCYQPTKIGDTIWMSYYGK